MEMQGLVSLASNEWRNRPEEERKATIQEALTESLAWEQGSREVTRDLSKYRVAADGDSLVLSNGSANGAVPSFHAFGQLSTMVGAPAAYLRRLPATLAAQNVNHGLAKLPEKPSLFYLAPRASDSATFSVVSLNSERYDRVPNSVPLSAALALQNHGWKIPPAWSTGPNARPATEADVIPGGSLVNVGDMIGNAGIYMRTGENLFVIQVNPAANVEGLFTFSIMWNDLTGKRTLGGVRGLIDFICGNHLLWGLQKDSVSVFKATHKDGQASKLARYLSSDYVTFATSGDPMADYRVIQTAKVLELGRDKEAVTEAVLAKRIPDLTKELTEAAFDRAEEVGRYGSPATLWGMLNGLTEVSQRKPDFESRFAVDVAAGKLVDAFVNRF